MIKILFQGDSITDFSRIRNDGHHLGFGYPRFAAENIARAYPNVEFEFLNRGVSGDRTDSFLPRLEKDLIDIQPDIVSILLGVNNVWHRHLTATGLTDERFEKEYRTILSRVKNETNAKLLLIEPYLLYTDAEKEAWRDELTVVRGIVRRFADEFADAFLPLSDLFMADEATMRFPIYSNDGVHPNDEGARFIARHYLTAVTPLIDGLLK